MLNSSRVTTPLGGRFKNQFIDFYLGNVLTTTDFQKVKCKILFKSSLSKKKRKTDCKTKFCCDHCQKWCCMIDYAYGIQIVFFGAILYCGWVKYCTNKQFTFSNLKVARGEDCKIKS